MHRYLDKKQVLLMMALAASILILMAKSVDAQSSVGKVEVGGQLSIIDMRESISEKPPGVGGRFTYNFTDEIAADTELNYFSTAEVDLNRTQGLFGIKAGKRFESVGVFAKARPGFMHFHGQPQPGVSVAGTTKFVTDLGGVFEIYPSKRFIVRIDVGDTIIFYGGQTIKQLSLPGGPQVQLDTTHNLQASIGIGFRF